MIHPITENFSEFTRRAWKTSSQQKTLLDQINQIDENSANSLVHQLNQVEWEVSALKTFTVFTALKALLQGSLQPSQIFTFYQFKNADEIAPSQLKMVEIFFKNIPSQFALNLIKEVVPEEIDPQAFAHQLALKPLSERRFFLIPDLDEDSNGCSITKSLMEQAGFNVFGQLTLNQKVYQMVPSFGMIETLAEMIGEVKPNPVLGLSSEEDMRLNFQRGIRDIAIETEETPLPKEADERPANKIQFTKHDIYHLMNHLNMPKKHQQGWLKVIDILDEIKGMGETALQKMILRVLDCEYYRANAIPDLKPSVYFWLVLGSIINEQPLARSTKEQIADILLQKILHASFPIPSKYIFAKTSIPYPGLSLLRNRVLKLKLSSLCQVPSSPAKT